MHIHIICAHTHTQHTRTKHAHTLAYTDTSGGSEIHALSTHISSANAALKSVKQNEQSDVNEQATFNLDSNDVHELANVSAPQDKHLDALMSEGLWSLCIHKTHIHTYIRTHTHTHILLTHAYTHTHIHLSSL